MSEPGITPLAQRLAEENNVDWRSLSGTGNSGQVVERDVLEYLARVMAGDEAVNPTPEPVPEGLESWPDQDLVTGPQSFGLEAGDEDEDWDFAPPAAQEAGAEPQPEPAADDLSLSEDIFLFDDDEDDSGDFDFGQSEPETTGEVASGFGFGVESEEQLLGKEDDLLDDFEFEDADLTDLAAEDGELDTPFLAEEDLSPFLHTQGGSGESLEEQFEAAAEESSLPDFDIDFSEIEGWDESGADDPEAADDPDLFTLEEEAGMEELLEPLGTEELEAGSPVVSPTADLSDLGFDVFDEPELDSFPEPEQEQEPESDELFLGGFTDAASATAEDGFVEPGSATSETVDDSAWQALVGDSEDDESWSALTRREPAEPEAETMPAAFGAFGSDPEPEPELESEPEPELEPELEPDPEPFHATAPNDESDIWEMDEPAPAAPALPLADFGTLLRRHLDVSLLSQAQTAVGLELGLDSGGTALPFLLRAAARALESVPLTGDSSGSIAAAILTADGLNLVADPGGGFREVARHLETVTQVRPGQELLPAGVQLAVADMSALQVDEAVLNVGVPVLTLGRVMHDSERGSFLSTLTLSGHYDIQDGARFLQLVSELLTNPLRLLI